MKKIILSAAIGAWCAISAMAVPARPGIRIMTQPDGSTVSLQMVGDERFHTLLTMDGLPVVRDAASGEFRYRTLDGVSAVMAHDPEMRTEAEKSFILTAADALNVDAQIQRAAARRAAPNKTIYRLDSQVQHIGETKIPVVLVQYSDYKFKDGANAKNTFQNFFNGAEVSARQYFVDQSNGKYTPQFDIYGPITLSNSRSYYGSNDYYGNDVRPGQMVAEACKGLDKEIDFSEYDYDGDGTCDVVIVLYAGDGEASSSDKNGANSIWPHQWELTSSDYGNYLKLDNTKINKYACFNELFGLDLKRIDGIGTVCHEFSHCLGLPDFYDTEYNANFGMGPWSLMDTGCYNDDGYLPIGYCAYEKEYLGWIKVLTPEPNSHITLPVWNTKNADSDVAYKLVSDKDPNECFYLENRQRQGWDLFMPSDGMLITHLTYDAAAWTNNVVNNYTPNRFTPVPADGKLLLKKTDGYYRFDPDNVEGDLWPYGKATEFTDTSTPAAALNNKGGYLGKPITEIKRNGDDTISFYFMKGETPRLTTPTLLPSEDSNGPDFTASWTHPNAPAGTTYTLEVAPYVKSSYVEYFNAKFPDAYSSGEWSSTGYVTAEVSASTSDLKMGSTKQGGSVISPKFDTEGVSEITVTVTAQSYGTDGSSVKITTLDPSGAEIGSKTEQLNTSMSSYTVTLPANTSGTTRVSVGTATNAKGRLYLTNATAYSGNPADAVALRRAAEAPYIYSDIKEMQYTVTGLPEGTYSYRVKAVPADTTQWAESAWSQAKTVTTLPTGALTISADATPEYYTLQGTRVAASSLTPGLYIVRQGTRTHKIIVR